MTVLTFLTLFFSFARRYTVSTMSPWAWLGRRRDRWPSATAFRPHLPILFCHLSEECEVAIWLIIGNWLLLRSVGSCPCSVFVWRIFAIVVFITAFMVGRIWSLGGRWWWSMMLFCAFWHVLPLTFSSLFPALFTKSTLMVTLTLPADSCSYWFTISWTA